MTNAQIILIGLWVTNIVCWLSPRVTGAMAVVTFILALIGSFWLI